MTIGNAMPANPTRVVRGCASFGGRNLDVADGNEGGIRLFTMYAQAGTINVIYQL